MTRWEYKLIHLNVGPPAGAKPSGQQAETPPGAAPAGPNPPVSPAPPPPAPLFSKAYLEQEFPDFYSHPPAVGQAAQTTNPVLQLQGFLNSQGQDGWCLIGLYNVGPLLLMAFRRRLTDLPSSPEAQATEPATATAQNPLFQDILQRLQRLEQVQSKNPTSPGQPTPDEAWILAPQQLQNLPCVGLSTTAEASERLGFRSTVSLNSFLRRHAYALGLVKRGATGWAAVYSGSDPAGGARRQHRWILLKDSELLGL